jgi:high-affinity Fe2+/Pb2+ permease
LKRENGKLFVIGLGIALLVAVAVSQFASSSPDGLEYVAEQEGFVDAAADHELSSGPLADYGEELTDNSWVNKAIAGAAGVLVTFVVGFWLFWLARRTNRDRPASV